MIIVALLSVILCVSVCFWAFSYVRNYNAPEVSSENSGEKENISTDDSEKESDEKVHIQKKEHASAATVIREAICSLKRGQWLVIIAVSALAALCFVNLDRNNVDCITLIKLMLSYAALCGAALIDAKIKKIPNVLCKAVIILRLIFIPIDWFFARETFKTAIIMSIAGLVGCLLILLLCSAVSKGGLGMGDVKLLSSIGFMSGIACAMYSMFLGMVVCTFAAIFLLLFRSKSMKDHIPFAPFIYAGFILYTFFC